MKAFLVFVPAILFVLLALWVKIPTGLASLMAAAMTALALIVAAVITLFIRYLLK